MAYNGDFKATEGVKTLMGVSVGQQYMQDNRGITIIRPFIRTSASRIS